MAEREPHSDPIPVSDVNFIVVDVETTGTSATEGRMTEIACVLVRDGEVRQSFTSLINPRQFIPQFIEKLTGITNAMVVQAPEEHEVMREVEAFMRLPNAVFVAHNVAFDLAFVREGMARHGMKLPFEHILCTCKLATRLLPKKTKKNLGSVASHFNVRNDARHRAYGDALATAHVLTRFLEVLEEDHDLEFMHEVIEFQNKRLKNFHTTPRVVAKVQRYLDDLPEAPGVYYMMDAKDNILYVGKAKSLADRVRSYFQMSAHHPEKIARMVRQVTRIRWEETGSELAALLLESKEIKRHTPPANTMSKKVRRYPFLRITTNTPFPVVELCDHVAQDGAEYYGPFLYRGMVYDVIETIESRFKLRVCRDEFVPSSHTRPCLYHHIGKCGAPCAMLQSEEEYALEVDKVRRFLSGYSEGVLAMIEHEMYACAERLEFENAKILRDRLHELRKVFDKAGQSATAINKTDIVLAVPASPREKTVEIFVVKEGFLVLQRTVGRKADLAGLQAEITALYRTEVRSEGKHSLQQIDELRILTQWMYRRRNDSTVINIDRFEPASALSELESCIRASFSHLDELPLNSIDHVPHVRSDFMEAS